MDKDNCDQDDFNSLSTCCRTYLQMGDVGDGIFNNIPRKKSCINNIVKTKKHSTEFQDK